MPYREEAEEAANMLDSASLTLLHLGAYAQACVAPCLHTRQSHVNRIIHQNHAQAAHVVLLRAEQLDEIPLSTVTRDLTLEAEASHLQQLLEV